MSQDLKQNRSYEERVSELEDRDLEMIEEKRGDQNPKSVKKSCNSYSVPQEGQHWGIGYLREIREGKGGHLETFKETIAENFPNLEKELGMHILKAKRNSN